MSRRSDPNQLEFNLAPPIAVIAKVVAPSTRKRVTRQPISQIAPPIALLSLPPFDLEVVRSEYNRARDNYSSFAKFSAVAAMLLVAIQIGVSFQELPGGFKVGYVSSRSLFQGTVGFIALGLTLTTAYFGVQAFRLDMIGRFSSEPEFALSHRFFGRFLNYSRRIFAFVCFGLAVVVIATSWTDMRRVAVYFFNLIVHPIGAWTTV